MSYHVDLQPITYQFEESIIKLKVRIVCYIINGSHRFFFATLQAAAERLDKDAAQCDSNPGPMVEAAKKIASMWKKMGELIMSGSSIASHRMPDMHNNSCNLQEGVCTQRKEI